MTPEEAKTKIEALLNLGTLQGVRVEYKNKKNRYFYKLLDKRIWSALNEQCAENSQPEYVYTDKYYQDIKSIHPIPLEPKLLKVGERVKIIGGHTKDKTGRISSDRNVLYYLIKDDISGEELSASIYNVIPESLLVEEEERPKLYRVLKELPGTKVGQIIDGFEMSISHGNGGGLYSVEGHEDFFEPIDPKEFK